MVILDVVFFCVENMATVFSAENVVILVFINRAHGNVGFISRQLDDMVFISRAMVFLYLR